MQVQFPLSSSSTKQFLGSWKRENKSDSNFTVKSENNGMSGNCNKCL